MNAEFDWWLLLVGIVGGAALVWLVVGDIRRHDDDLADDERRLEAEWIAEAFTAAGRDVDATTVGEVLELHRAYLAGPAPDLDPLENPPATRQPGPAEAASAAAAALNRDGLTSEPGGGAVRPLAPAPGEAPRRRAQDAGS